METKYFYIMCPNCNAKLKKSKEEAYKWSERNNKDNSVFRYFEGKCPRCGHKVIIYLPILKNNFAKV